MRIIPFLRLLRWWLLIYSSTKLSREPHCAGTKCLKELYVKTTKRKINTTKQTICLYPWNIVFDFLDTLILSSSSSLFSKSLLLTQLSLRHYSSILNSSLGLPSAQSGRLTRLFGKLAGNPFISTHIGRNRPLAVDTMFAVVRKQLRSHPAVSLARPSCGNDDFEERISWIPTICEFLLLTSLAQLVSAASCG